MSILVASKAFGEAWMGKLARILFMAPQLGPSPPSETRVTQDPRSSLTVILDITLAASEPEAPCTAPVTNSSSAWVILESSCSAHG
jgi:hypothetical protein